MAPFVEPALSEIKVRSHGRSELSGRTDRPLECMHFDHSRNETYNKKERGMRVTVTEHLAYHLLFKGNEAAIGMKPCTNDWAIDQLNMKSVAFLHKIGHLSELEHEIEDAKERWIIKLSLNT